MASRHQVCSQSPRHQGQPLAWTVAPEENPGHGTPALADTPSTGNSQFQNRNAVM